MVDGLAKQYAARYEIRLLDASGNDPNVAKYAQELGIQYVPTFVFVNSNGSVNGSIVGEVPVAQLEAELAKLK